MPPVIYPYTVTNSYKGGLFMRTYSRNVRRAWDGEEYRPPKRQRLDNTRDAARSSSLFPALNSENATIDVDLEDNLERAIRETSVAMSSSPSRKASTIFSHDSQEDDNGSNTVTPPSSPPPTLQLTPPIIKVRKPTFTVIEKQKKERERETLKVAKRKHDALSTSFTGAPLQRDESEPLQEIHNSSSRAQSMFPNLGASNTTIPQSQSHSQPQTQPPPLSHAQPQPLSWPPPPPPQTTTTPIQTSEQPIQTTSDTTPRPLPVKLPRALTQTVLDFGQSLAPTTCRDCGMSYTPSIADDVSQHDSYHNRDLHGIDLGKPFLKSAMKWCYEVPHIPGAVVVVDRKISVPGRKAVQKVLEVVNRDLGGVEINEEELWSQRALEGDEIGRKCDRYKAFLHVIEGKCVGVCLAERISKAHKVVPADAPGGSPVKLNGYMDSVKKQQQPQPATETTGDNAMSAPHHVPARCSTPTVKSSSISISQGTHSAIVGVSRIWTSKAYRRKGIANNLLECVMNQFIYGMEIDRTEIAFSQPTESGGGLARGWFGSEIGWSVYQEE